MMDVVVIQMLDENGAVSFSIEMPTYIKSNCFDARLKSEEKATSFIRDNFKQAVINDKVEEFFEKTLVTTPFGQLYVYTAIANLGLSACLEDKVVSEYAVKRIETAMRKVSEINFSYKFLMYVFEEVVYRVNKQRCPYSDKYRVQVFTQEERNQISNEAFANNIESAVQKIKKEKR